MVVVAIGVVAEDALARAAASNAPTASWSTSILLTSDPAISAIGDCADFPACRAWIPHPARIGAERRRSGPPVAARLAGKPEPYTNSPGSGAISAT